jgi:hypothetical protein
MYVHMYTDALVYMFYYVYGKERIKEKIEYSILNYINIS